MLNGKVKTKIKNREQCQTSLLINELVQDDTQVTKILE